MSSVKQALEQYAKQNNIPMHMPGHKRNPTAAPYLNSLSEQMDVTEIEGMDDLHAPTGILKQAMDRAARAWGSDRSFFLVNGSTCGILAGIRALTHRGDRVLVMRNSHKSVFHAIELCGLQPVFVLPPVIQETGIFGSLSPKMAEEALEREQGIRLVILTSPTYEGVISDVKEICRLAHRRNIPVLVDEAHGAHLGFHPAFPGGAVQAGADITVQSLHKTLPSLTQTAILHVKGSRVDQKRLEHQLAVFETSSPSYLLLASMDGCVQTLCRENFQKWADCLTAFQKETSALRCLKIMGQTKKMFYHDPGKVVISTADTDLTGEALAGELRKRRIEPELAAPAYVLAMTGMGDTPKTMHRLASALLDIDRSCSPAFLPRPSLCPSCPELALLPERAMEQEFELIPLGAAAGRISAEYVWAYPPGVPLIIPGERIPRHLSFGQASLYSTRGCFPDTLAVVSEK